jgi:MFS family permease
MAGAWVGPAYLARIGHIRVFAAAAALAAGAVLTVYWAHGAGPWLVNRFATGAAAALAFAAGESWLNGAIGQGERGGAIGFYMVCTKAALALGPFLIAGARPTAPEPLMTAAILLTLAIAPICFTSQAQPEPPKAQPLAIGAQYKTAPAAVIACFGAGLINSGVLAIAPLYAQARFGPGAAIGFQGAAWVGSMIVQWPVGRVSDYVDRRLVIAALLVVSGAAALALALTDGRVKFTAAALLFALWGACELSFYGVAVAHMADRAGPGQITHATAGLLFVWAAGSVIGPALLGPLTDLFGAGIIFWFAAAIAWALAGAMVWRRRRRAEGADKVAFSHEGATSVAAAELAYGADKKAN